MTFQNIFENLNPLIQRNIYSFALKGQVAFNLICKAETKFQGKLDSYNYLVAMSLTSF